MPTLATAVDLLGGQTKLALAIGVRQQHVWNWMNRRDAVPPEFCTAIERATEGKVTRRDLRPDDWHRIWPELVTKQHPAPKAPDRAAV